MRAWETPDGTGPPAATLDAHLEVQVVERRADWARIVCSNGWGAWVDARRLLAAGGVPPVASANIASAPLAAATPVVASAAPMARTATPTRTRASGVASFRGVGVCTLAGVVAVIVGSFLDWWSVTLEFDSGSVTSATSAWDSVPVEFLVTGDVGSGDGLDVGPLLLVVVVLLIPLLTAKPFPGWFVGLVSLVPIAAGLAGLLRNGYGDLSFDPGIGLVLVLAGGALIATDAVLMFLASRRART
jgi:hypothetical protein